MPGPASERADQLGHPGGADQQPNQGRIEAEPGEVQRQRGAVDVECRLGEEEADAEPEQRPLGVPRGAQRIAGADQHQNSVTRPPRHRPGP